MPLTNASTRSPEENGRSSRIGVISRSAICDAGPIFSRKRPGSPWMPIPISTSSSASSKLGLPEAGVMHGVSAMPIERPFALTLRPSSATSWSERPSSAAPPQIFSTSTVTPTPRRPAVYSESSTATSSLVSTVSTCDVLALPHVGGHVEVHDVAGVVLDDVNDAGATVDGLRRLEHLVGRGRGEHFPRTSRVEHARPDVPAVHRLMTRAASGDEPDLALDGRVDADDDGWFVDDPYSVAVCCFNAMERVLEDRVGRIDELFHAPSLKPGGPVTGPY